MKTNDYLETVVFGRPNPSYAGKVPAIRQAVAESNHPGELCDMLSVILSTANSPGASELAMTIYSSVGQSNGVGVPADWPPEWDPRRVEFRRRYAAQNEVEQSRSNHFRCNGNNARL